MFAAIDTSCFGMKWSVNWCFGCCCCMRDQCRSLHFSLRQARLT